MYIAGGVRSRPRALSPMTTAYILGITKESKDEPNEARNMQIAFTIAMIYRKGHMVLFEEFQKTGCSCRSSLV